MGLSRTVYLLGRGISPASRVAHGVGVTVLALMMFLTATDVFLRYVFNRPILGSYELTEYMMAILVAFTIAYCAVKKGHVSVDLVVSRLPQQVQAVLYSVSCLIFLGFSSLIAWRSFLQARILYFAGSTSSALYIPQFPFVIVTSFGFGLLSVVMVMQFLNSLYRMVEKWNH